MPWREGRRHSPPDSAPSVLAGPTSVRHVPHLVTARSKPVVRLLQGRQPWTPVVRHERHGQCSLPPAAPPTHETRLTSEKTEPARRRREKPSLWRPPSSVCPPAEGCGAGHTGSRPGFTPLRSAGGFTPGPGSARLLFFSAPLSNGGNRRSHEARRDAGREPPSRDVCRRRPAHTRPLQLPRAWVPEAHALCVSDGRRA